MTVDIIPRNIRERQREQEHQLHRPKRKTKKY